MNVKEKEKIEKLVKKQLTQFILLLLKDLLKKIIDINTTKIFISFKFKITVLTA